MGGSARRVGSGSVPRTLGIIVGVLVAGVLGLGAVHPASLDPLNVFGVHEDILRRRGHPALVVALRGGPLPVDDRDAVLIVEQLVKHLSEVEHLAVVDADRQHASRFEHRLHHLESRIHEAHPLRVAGRVLFGHEVAEPWVVWVLVPAVVIAEVIACVVWRICQDQVNLATFAVERHHRLEVVALDDEVAGLCLGVARRERFDPLQHARADQSSAPPRVRLATERDLDAGLLFLLDQGDELFAVQIEEVGAVVHAGGTTLPCAVAT